MGNIDFQTIKDYLIPAIIAVVTWFSKDRILNRLNIKQKKAEVESSEANSIKDNLNLYQDIINDLENRYKSRIIEFENDLNKLKEINQKLKNYIEKQETIIKKYVGKCGEIE